MFVYSDRSREDSHTFTENSQVRRLSYICWARFIGDDPGKGYMDMPYSF
jgi:hypothetical protein